MARPRLVFETYLRAAPEQIWQALTDPAFTTKYYFGQSIESGWQTGDAWTAVGDDGATTLTGTIEAAVPYSRLVMTFSMTYAPELAAEKASLVTWEITPVGDVCRLTCVHTQLFGSPRTAEVVATGWSVILASLKSLLETGEPLGPVPEDGKSPLASDEPVDVAWHRAMGIECNNTAYDLFAKADRTADDDAVLIHRAHAAAYHWNIAGTDVHRARSEYLVSRAHAFVGQGESARYHAERCLALVTGPSSAEMADFDVAFAREAMARAFAASGNLAAAASWYESAEHTEIADPEDRSICEGDLREQPWFGLR